MSDTLPEGEDQIPTSAHRTNSSGNCSISGCPCRGWSAQGTARLTTMIKNCPHGDYPSLCSRCALARIEVTEHEPAARGGGDSERVRQIQKRVEEGNFCIGERLEDPYNLSTRLDDTEYLLEQHQSLVAEREGYAQLLTAAKSLIAMNNCNYDREVMRSEGGFEVLQKAVDTIEKRGAR